ncbi:MAG: ABC transporter ATP-binding protein [Parcubacteria group bacterium]
MAGLDHTLVGELRERLQTNYSGDVSALVKDIEMALKAPRIARTASTAKVIVEVRNLTKSYKVGDHFVEALRDVSLSIAEGEIVAIMGPSGSGKTTLLNMLGGLDRPTHGQISVAGLNLHNMRDRTLSAYRNKVIGFVFQFFYLQPFLTVRQNVAIPLLFGGRTRHTDIDAALADVGLSDRANHRPSQLSGGQAQRAAMARALVNKPQILLADEPTGNLDQHTAGEILALLRELNRAHGTTIILVTHDKHVAALADRVFTIKDGRLL